MVLEYFIALIVCSFTIYCLAFMKRRGECRAEVKFSDKKSTPRSANRKSGNQKKLSKK